MLVLACVVVALCTTRLSGGRLRRLALLPWRHAWLLPLALAAQIVIVEVPGVARGLSVVVHVLSYVVAGVFVWLNRQVSGLWLLGLGAACNGVTIAVNGGTLPASPRALAAVGIHPEGGFTNSGPLAHPVLPWLGDVFATPSWLPLANVFSVGDVLIALGAAWLIHAGARGGPRQVPAVADGPSLSGRASHRVDAAVRSRRSGEAPASDGR
ncbi:MAG: DUF5317 domain-containing protein [Actinomycetota bacterium]